MSDSSNSARACMRCGRVFPRTVDFFPIADRRTGQLRTDCYDCKRAAGRAYNARNREKLRAKTQAIRAQPEVKAKRAAEHRAYYLANREHVIARTSRWKAENHDRRKAKDREWRQRNPNRQKRFTDPEGFRAYIQSWKAKNPEKLRAYRHRRRARLNASALHHTGEDVQRQFKNQQGRCYWCAQKIQGDEYHIDHIFPLSKGGSNGPENICIACISCNTRKGPKDPIEFIGRLF